MLYDRFTRLLHLLIASGLVVQLVNSLVMVHPKPGRQGDTWYGMHEIWGQALLGLLVAHWIWCLLRAGNISFALLFPWFSPSRRLAIKEDIRRYLDHAARFRLPDSGERISPLASAVQGLGLSVATLLGVSGLILFVAMEENGEMSGWARGIKEAHEVMGALMWGYLLVHGIMVVLHQLAGHGGLRAMLRVWERNPR
ncbi:MAG: cytochrome b/b6 domain-containing protein [Magnetococcales bacterium]|nr:cytochrome b/b6 domain-containing protein [Magnetococcales bacterium]